MTEKKEEEVKCRWCGNNQWSVMVEEDEICRICEELVAKSCAKNLNIGVSP